MQSGERRIGEDRRRGSVINGSLPFLTKEGLVFTERRVGPDRRGVAYASQTSGKAQADLKS